MLIAQAGAIENSPDTDDLRGAAISATAAAGGAE
jgi:hypothetical protein